MQLLANYLISLYFSCVKALKISQKCKQAIYVKKKLNQHNIFKAVGSTFIYIWQQQQKKTKQKSPKPYITKTSSKCR